MKTRVLIHRERRGIRLSLQMFAFNADGMTMLEASLADKPSAQMTREHRTRSSTDRTKSDDIDHFSSLPKENQFFA